MNIDCDRPTVKRMAIYVREPSRPPRGTLNLSSHAARINADSWSILPSGVIPGAEVNWYRLSPIVTAYYMIWLRDCLSNHDACNAIGHAGFPARVLDLGDHRTALIGIRLVANNTPEKQYVALSYCWGATKPLCTTKLNHGQHNSSIDVNKLPTRHREALSTTRALVFRYLWFDALCIVQDDPEDCEDKIAKMGEIFQNATLVLVNADATDVPQSFLENPSVHDWNTVAHTNEGKLDVRVRCRPYLSHSEHGPCQGCFIDLRGWTFQERLVARRCLIFRRGEVI